MKVVYTGRYADISDGQKAKLQRKFDKINRILSRGGDVAPRVVLSRERRGCEAEVTLRALHHTLVVTGHNAQAFAAAHIAVDKLERQAARNKRKLVDVRRPFRHRDEPKVQARQAIAPENQPEPKATAGGPQRSQNEASKPLTVEEAQIELESGDSTQITYRDAEIGHVCVMFRGPSVQVEVVETPA